MRKFLIIILATMLVAGTAAAGSNLVRSHLGRGDTVGMKATAADLSAKLQSFYGAQGLTGNVYVGAEFCLACHGAKSADDHSTWKKTRHSQMLRRPMKQWTLVDGKGVIAASAADQKVDDFIAGLDLATIPSFKAYGANAPKLAYDLGTDTYMFKVGALTLKVVATVAGSAGQDGQRFIVRVPVTDTDTKWSKALYFAPASYTRSAGWAPASGWYDANFNPKFDATVTSDKLVATGGPSSHTKSCIMCHSSGMRGLGFLPSGEATFQGYPAILFDPNDPGYFDYNNDGQFELVNITCESCHGPGGLHVMGGGDKTKIVNPAKLTGAQSSEVCARCHGSLKSMPNKTYNFAYDETTQTEWIPRFDTWIPLATMGTPTVNTWPDGWLPNHGRPWDYYIKSAHASTKYGQGGSSEPCAACHDLHDKQAPAQVVTSRFDARANLTFKTSAEDNTLCLSCHATHGPFANIKKEQVADYAKNVGAIAAVVEQHTHHPYGPERMMGLSRCVDCHMSADGSHTWKVTTPEDTLKYQAKGGMPNACAQSCHNTYVNIFGLGLDPTPSTWNTTFDQSMATTLQKYYGPKGLWWDTTPKP